MVRNTALALNIPGLARCIPQLSRDCRGIMSAVGTLRRFAAVPNFGSDRSEADMPRALGAHRSDENERHAYHRCTSYRSGRLWPWD